MTGYIEQWGTGTNEMVKRCLEWGIPEPEFELSQLVSQGLLLKVGKARLTKYRLNPEIYGNIQKLREKL